MSLVACQQICGFRRNSVQLCVDGQTEESQRLHRRLTHAVPGNTTADELFKDFPDVAAMLKDFARAECPTILVIVRFVSAQSAARFSA